MDENEDRINVTKPSLPDLEEFIPYLEEIWGSRWLTNNGKFHQQFEEELAEFLGVKHVSLISNGTLGLMIALRALRIRGEVITTPFSFVATSNVLRWDGIKPIFSDIEEDTFNLDPKKIEAIITPKTTAILPVHVYGNPCDNKSIQQIADRYGLKVLYDAAHAFGVEKEGESILNWGDLSVLSFHATKVFNTFEGGAIISHSDEMKQRVDYLKNFGFGDKETVVLPGINGKMNEFQAALGFLQIKHVNKYIERRKEIAELYKEELESCKGVETYSNLNNLDNLQWNYIYFPVLVSKKEYGLSRDSLHQKLKFHDIYTRKYFYPLISDYPIYYDGSFSKPNNLSNASNIANKVLCLPLYSSLGLERAKKIINLIKEYEKNTKVDSV